MEGTLRARHLRASDSRDRVEAKPPHGDDPEEDEEHENDELCLLERRLGLRRRERMQGRHRRKPMTTIETEDESVSDRN